MGWKGESRRHSLARKGVKTVIDSEKRFDVSKFVANGRVIHGYDIDEIYNGFIEAMLWATTEMGLKDDEEIYLEDNYTIHDIDKDTEQAIKYLIEDFIYENYELFDEIQINFPDQHTHLSDEQIGHDLFLTTQGHGVGFWDRGYGYNGEILTKESLKFFNDSMYAYAGDDGKIYFEGLKLKSSGSSKQKKWEVVMISPHGRTVIEEVTLGRQSNKFDVVQQLKREGIGGEIVQIKELKASGRSKFTMIRDLMRKEGIEDDNASPNFVKDFADNRGIKLTAKEVVDISNRYKLKASGVSSDVARVKKSLINKAKKKGLTENFGQNEVRKLRDKYSDYQYGTEEQRKQWRKIESLDDWAMNYDGR